MRQILKRIKKYFFPVFLFCIISPSFVYSQTLRDLYESAVDAYNKGDYDRSIQLYQQINKDMPQFAPAYIGLGLALKAKGADTGEVLYYYKTAVDKDPTNVQALEQLGRLYYSIGQPEKAQALFEKALKINPSMTSIKLTLGWINLMGRRTNPGRAIGYFQEVLKVTPSSNVYFGLGLAYFSSNQREKALEIITDLRGMGANDYAEKLEKAVRENRKVVLDDFSESSEEDAQKDSFDKTSDAPKGMKVRLRGKLDNL